MLDDYVKRILTAPVYDVARFTPLDRAVNLSRRFDNTVWLKREDMQPVFSYKIRGAYNLIASLDPDTRQRGVIAASAGNHAQGVAYAAQELGIPALIVMPKTTPDIKVTAVRQRGAEIVLHGNSYDEASVHAHDLVEQRGMTYIPPFDHPLVIAGQGTVGMEILRQHQQPPHAIFAPVGGGGLVAGVGAYIKALFPEVRIIGVEPVDAASMKAALDADRLVELENCSLFADGAAVRQAGSETFALCREVVDEIITVSVDEMCASIKDIFEDTRAIAEPAGSLAVAGMKTYVKREGLSGESLVAIVSGANVNFDRLRHIAERAELGEEREALLAATIPERPGAFRHFCKALGARQVTEFNYRYADADSAHVFAGVQLRHGMEEKQSIIEHLEAEGYPVVDMTDDEMAKIHVRYMVGGRGQSVADERILRFEFPERPGALLQFLNRVSDRWNISLFHYRNHGAEFGRVLMGMQVPAADHEALNAFLAELGLNVVDETDNPAYRLFLS